VNEHPQPEEIFDEYVLGALEGEEKQAVEQHVKSCPECSQKLERARARLALLALASPPATPSPAVKERLMRQIASQRTGPVPAPVRRHTGFWGWGGPILAVAAVVLAVLTGLLANRNRHLNQRVWALEAEQRQELARQRQQAEGMARARAILDVLTSSDTLKVALISAPAHVAPEGTAFYNPQKGLVFYAADLTRLPSDQTYQLWLVPTQGKPISAGIFKTDLHGNGEVLLPPLPRGVSAKAFAVTIEPSGGEPQPTGRKVLIGAVS
jgi:anti-sigma-K factor RskA